ncbi:Two component regulator three Y domain-containing protein [Neobacillus sp. PS2-9]|uniref:Two component regulator three Y domain-containing protein n=1 Tax=Neobacillus sp. PS2-9 TaxID=3070676 RepID=UPI0027E0A18A|nr:Two component regulator three Y domain-containing protein [Neobacillus sp. PS2-9]WML58601.1 Two component regulator three Y domain-containing protein [Neobacillus sp. PS2-9]
MFNREKVYKGEVDIKYLFFKSHKPTTNLVVVFSGIPPIGTPPRYNYIKTLEGYNCNKLFILDDFGSRASYYLCENRNYAIERSVISLINHISNENGITEILSCGSSKGGFAALYFGIKYGFKHIIAGSPQFLLGEYLLRFTNSQNIANFMVGGSDDEDFEYLDSILTNLINSSNHKPNILIHVGKGEYHYKTHVLPMIDLLQKRNIPYKLDLGNYNKHSEVALYFPKIIQQFVSEAFHFPIIKHLNEKRLDPNKYLYQIETKSPNDLFAFYLFHNEERIVYKPYSSDNKFEIVLEKEGKYSVTAFAKSPEGRIVAIKGKPVTLKSHAPIK